MRCCPGIGKYPINLYRSRNIFNFMLAEVFVPSFGALGFGGVIAFVIGSIILFDEGSTGYAVSLPLILSLILSLR